MSLYLIAVIKADKKENFRYRVIDLDDPQKRSIAKGRRTYCFTELVAEECRNKKIGGLKYRNEIDRKNSFRYSRCIPIIDGTNIINETSILKCSDRILVDYMGRQVFKAERPKNCVIVDVRLISQKISKGRTDAYRTNAFNGNMPLAIEGDFEAIKDKTTDSEFKELLAHKYYRNKSRKK